MKLTLFILLLFNGFTCATRTVYVCDSPNATKYHYKADCRGLSNCQRRIIEITLEDAKKSNKSLCRWER